MTAKTQMRYDFDRGVSYHEALRTVRAALEDEGLTISSANTLYDRVRGVLLPDAFRLIVPLSRIVRLDPTA